ncbi:MAG TPA: polysaccharide deacetylase family protein [Atopostipes sp.]|nr:polysaccharide deacetylase family protein [Atopostipes sp.]
MKKVILSTVLISTLLLSACQDDAASSNEDTSAVDETTEEVETTEEDATEEEVVEEEVEEEEDLAYQYEINPNIFSVEPIDGETTEDEKLVLLTFDDAPYGNSLEIAEALEERGVNAIFFVNSMYMEDEEGKAAIQDLHERGFEIANHTHTHAKLDDYSEENQREEIITTNDIVEEATGERPRFFRAPHGIMTEYSKQVVAEEGMTWMNWSFGYDWEVQYQDADALADITLNTELLGNGANILMHDREWTAAAVPTIVDGLIEQGFTIVNPKLITHE